MTSQNSGTAAPRYNYDIIKLFTIAATFWGIVGFSAGVTIASQLAFPFLNFDLEWFCFGRLRPLHTSVFLWFSALLKRVFGVMIIY
jgi:cytochrome c oxidase cbb3-type subunit 1